MIAGPFTRALFFRYVLINVTTYTINFYEERKELLWKEDYLHQNL